MKKNNNVIGIVPKSVDEEEPDLNIRLPREIIMTKLLKKAIKITKLKKDELVLFWKEFSQGWNKNFKN